MNNIESFRKSKSDAYLSDEALEKLISETESEPLLRPPKEFKSDIIGQIYRKKKYLKNVRLFSYSAKVIVATAAAIVLMLIVPENIRPEDSAGMEQRRNLQEQRDETKEYSESPIWQLNRKMNEYYDRLNDGLSQLMGMEVNLYEKEE